MSEIVVARRSLDLSLITKDGFFRFYDLYINRLAADNNDDSSGENFYASQNFRIGRRFGETVARATLEGKLLYNEAYRLTSFQRTHSK